MITDFDPHTDYRQRSLDLNIMRPTTNSCWLAVIVLCIGLMLAIWYIVLGGPTQRLHTGQISESTNPARSASPQQAAP
jgi:hypothetical protein